MAEDVQTHAVFEKVTQPAAVGALASDEADPWLIVGHEKQFRKGGVRKIVFPVT
ncbi:hypothetical protein GCM10007901_37280 [Dyella acidisoli]|uniref:Uncharacterized protein n=1 Tax=Dyella acidisoli TaxID=1867834 RepID=A0ABQ5XWA5_9GAMM|nr:hypothetical protein GCM10007901_37280 [Dyella acidisoli]